MEIQYGFVWLVVISGKSDMGVGSIMINCRVCGVSIEDGREYHRTLKSMFSGKVTYLCYDCIGDVPNKPPRFRE